MNRRDLLATLTASLATGAPAAPLPAFDVPGPDAELVRLCAAYVAQSRQFCDVGQHTHDMLCSDPEWMRCNDLACAMVPELHALEEEIADTPARTVRGLLAKAEAARHQMSGDADRDTGPMDPTNDLAWSLIGETLDVLRREIGRTPA